MGIIKTIKGIDGRPFISLEDMIKEFEFIINNINEKDSESIEKKEYLNFILKTLYKMEEDYYNNYLFKKNNRNNNE